MPQWVVGYHEADSLNEVETELSEVLVSCHIVVAFFLSLCSALTPLRSPAPRPTVCALPTTMLLSVSDTLKHGRAQFGGNQCRRRRSRPRGKNGKKRKCARRSNELSLLDTIHTFQA